MDLGSPTVPSGGGFAEFGGFSGRSGTGTGGGGGGHIDAFIQKQSLNASSPFPPQSAGRISKSSGGGGDGRREAQGGGGFSRSVTAWQLQRRLQKKVTKLENGMSSQVSFEEVEKEVQVRWEARMLDAQDHGRSGDTTVAMLAAMFLAEMSHAFSVARCDENDDSDQADVW